MSCLEKYVQHSTPSTSLQASLYEAIKKNFLQPIFGSLSGIQTIFEESALLVTFSVHST